MAAPANDAALVGGRVHGASSFDMALNPPITDWHGRVVWLVGASTGIGRATAEALLTRGARVVVSARDVAAIDAFQASHPGSLGIALDVTDRAAIEAAAGRIVSTLGRVDVMLYCAAYYKALRATAFDLDEALRHNAVNYVGALNSLAAVLPRLLAQGAGHIGLMASVAGYRGLPQSLGYGPTKAALINLAEVLYLDLHDHGIGVSVVNPGFVETPLTAANTFAMPALISAQQAAEEIIAGLGSGQFEIHFPKRFTRTLKALGLLGDGLYFKAVRRLTGL